MHLFRVLDILVSVSEKVVIGNPLQAEIIFVPQIIKASFLQEVAEWWLVDLSRTNCCRANLIITFTTEKGIWIMKIVAERFRLMVLIIYMAMLGMQI